MQAYPPPPPAQYGVQPTQYGMQPLVGQPMMQPVYQPQPQMQPLMQPMTMSLAPQQQQQQQSTISIIKTGGDNSASNTNTNTVPVVTRFPENPVHTVCHICHNQVVTSTTSETGTFTWLMFCVLFVLGLWVCCCCLCPFCMDGCKDVRHTCPNCQNTLGTHKKL